MASMSFGHEDIVSILLATLSLIGVCFTAWVSSTVKKETKQINSAVNNIPVNGIRLYDAVLSHSEAISQLSSQVSSLHHDIRSLPCVECPLPKKIENDLTF